MRFGELRKVIPEDVTVWVEDDGSGNYITANQNRYIGEEFDDYEVAVIYPEKYQSISSRGITVRIKYLYKVKG